MKNLSFTSKALIANFVIWMLFIGISLSASFIDSSRAQMEINVAARVYGYLISFVPWMLVTPIFYWYLHKQHRSRRTSLTRTTFILLIVWAPFVVTFESLSYKVMRSLDDSSLIDVFLKLPIFFWVYCLVLFGVILGGCLSLLYYQRYNANKIAALKATQDNVELELQLSELRIQSLLSQLEPHFLFNALNSIASLVRVADKKQALTAITCLSDLLRYAIEASKSKFVDFEQELDFVKDYLSLQKLRFDKKLNIQLIDNRQSKNQQCPPFILQILVENSIKHGLEKNGEFMQLDIQITSNQQELTLVVKNTQSNPDKENRGLGIGLTNLNARLNILYNHTISIHTLNESEYYQTTITIPSEGES